MKSSPFDHRPQRDLGNVLREALGPVDDRAFVERVMNEAQVIDRRVFRGDEWDVLSAWARPGMAVAGALVVLTAIVALSTRLPAAIDDVTIGDALNATISEPAPPLLLASPGPPDVDVILATVFER